MVSSRASSCSAGWSAIGRDRPVTSSQSTMKVAPRRRRPPPGLRTNSWVTNQSRVRRLLDRDVHERHALAGLAEVDRAVEQLGGHEGLVAALLEAPQVDGAGHDDLSGVDGRDLRHRDEDPAAGLDLDHETREAGRVGADAEHHDGVAYLAHLVAIRVEDSDAGQAREEYSGRGASRHVERLPPTRRGAGHGSADERRPHPRAAADRRPRLARRRRPVHLLVRADHRRHRRARPGDRLLALLPRLGGHGAVGACGGTGPRCGA